MEKPVFLKGEFRHDDFAQGKISDCWFMSALSCLTLNQPLAEKLIPIQSFDNDYAGQISLSNVYCVTSNRD